jgi:DNA-directed RNA polymerase subunit RPC12/RpoP
MPTWDCGNCNMPMTLIERNPNVSCPNCGKRMIEIAD